MIVKDKRRQIWAIDGPTPKGIEPTLQRGWWTIEHPDTNEMLVEGFYGDIDIWGEAHPEWRIRLQESYVPQRPIDEDAVVEWLHGHPRCTAAEMAMIAIGYEPLQEATDHTAWAYLLLLERLRTQGRVWAIKPFMQIYCEFCASPPLGLDWGFRLEQKWSAGEPPTSWSDYERNCIEQLVNPKVAR